MLLLWLLLVLLLLLVVLKHEMLPVFEILFSEAVWCLCCSDFETRNAARFGKIVFLQMMWSVSAAAVAAAGAAAVACGFETRNAARFRNFVFESSLVPLLF